MTEYMTTSQAVAYTGISRGRLISAVDAGRGPVWIEKPNTRATKRTMRWFAKDALDAWMDTADYGRMASHRGKPLTPCSVEGCESIAEAKGMCFRHNKASKSGLPLVPRVVRDTTSVLARDAEGRKICSLCKEWRNVASFTKSNARIDGLAQECNACVRLRNVKTRYGLSAGDYEALVVSADGACAICGAESSERSLAVDHCHASLGVRGLLCAACNLGLGHVRDSPTVLASLCEYVASEGVSHTYPDAPPRSPNAPIRGAGAVRDDQGRKRCGRCLRWYELSSFGVNAARKDGLKAYCRSCDRISVVASRYKVRPEYISAAFESQGSRCATCDVDLAGGMPCVDLDHKSGRVRGILCSPCNKALGAFAERTDVMRAAARYLTV